MSEGGASTGRLNILQTPKMCEASGSSPYTETEPRLTEDRRAL